MPASATKYCSHLVHTCSHLAMDFGSHLFTVGSYFGCELWPPVLICSEMLGREMALGELVNGTNGVIFMVKDAYDQRRRYRDKAASTRELAEKIGTVATLEFPHAVPEEPYEDSPTEDIVSGTSQISAAGKACIPLGVLYILDNFNYQ